MDSSQLPMRVATSSFLSGPIGQIFKPLQPTLQRLVFPDDFVESFTDAGQGCEGTIFAERFLSNLGISYALADEDAGHIPTSGPAVVVCNHPFGFLEGLILMSVLGKLRPDYRIVANSLLASVTQLRRQYIFINPFQEQNPARENASGVRECVKWIKSGGLLVMFPAGEVAHLNFGESFVADARWADSSARLACKLDCPTIPMYFSGANSIPFQVAGTVHANLRTLNLPRELMKKRNHTIDLRAGSPIPSSVLRSQKDAAAATAYLRARVYLLSSRLSPALALGQSELSGGYQVPAAARTSETGLRETISNEVSALPSYNLLASSEDFHVYLATAEQAPVTLQEIGRCRELTFRAVGEGTKNSTDLDSFDDHYQHLFLWSRRDHQIAGAYRLAATPDVLRKFGPKGLYTSTLFQYSKSFFERLGPAFELGRSFILPEYQKHYASLLMLWKGIARCVERRPECPVLFGAVSISNDYNPLSRVLIMNFMTEHMSSDLAGLVKPKRGYRPPLVLPRHIKQLNSLLSTVEELSSSISDLEADGKGIPVLLRQYVRMGGQFLGFNVDPKFANTLDGLILADLRAVPAAMLNRFMGSAAASDFRTRHGLPAPTRAYSVESATS